MPLGLASALCLVAGLILLPPLEPVHAAERSFVEASTPDPDFTLREVAGPFEFPWSIAQLPDGRLLVTERAGRLQLVDPATGGKSEITGLPPIFVESHAGLMDVALDPGFADNSTIYLSYAHGTKDASSIRLLKAKVDLEALKLEGDVIFETVPPVKGVEQYGGRIAFDREGYLYLSVGDRFEGERAQNLADHQGSILRLARDGSTPPDNPFVNHPNALPQIWSYGHRNPQGLAFDEETGVLWSHEHGPAGGDEVNIVQPGLNYGWPIITYGRNYDGTPVGIGTEREGLEQPLHRWTPSIAPSGLAVINEDMPTGRRKRLWLGALAGERLVRLTIEDGQVARQEQFLLGEIGRIRDVRATPDGRLYLVTDSPEGKLYELAPATETAILTPVETGR